MLGDHQFNAAFMSGNSFREYYGIQDEFGNIDYARASSFAGSLASDPSANDFERIANFLGVDEISPNGFWSTTFSNSEYSNYGNMRGATYVDVGYININHASGGGFQYQESVAGGGFFIGGLAGSFESGFDLGARSLEQVKVVTSRAANGAYITESRHAVSLANKSAYVRATSTANVLKIGGRIVGGGVVAYNGLNLLANGGTDKQVAQFVTQSIITGVGFLGPIGFGVSLALTATEMAGGFDFIYDSFDNTKINRVGFD